MGKPSETLNKMEEHERMCNHNFLGLLERQKQIENTINGLKYDLETVEEAINLHIEITQLTKVPNIPVGPEDNGDEDEPNGYVMDDDEEPPNKCPECGEIISYHKPACPNNI